MKNKIEKKYLLLLLTFFSITSLYSQTEYQIHPSDTDIAIDNPDLPHYVYINEEVEQKDKLFFFLAGTGGEPFHYQEILKRAANLGYHSIGLSYPNDIAINLICGLSIDTTCHSRARLEIFDGIDRHNGIDVDASNCIENRLEKLLIHLDDNYSDQGWNQFMEADSINWSKIRISGHSQGGGHSAIISKIKEVDRAILFASSEWLPLSMNHPDWVSWESLTPTDRIYGLAHQSDELLNFDNLQVIWEIFGMMEIGEITLADDLDSPYNNAQALYTQVIPDNDPEKFHNSVAVDLYTPFEEGIPILQPVWDYLIDYDPESQVINNEESDLIISPNPANHSLNILNSKANSEYQIMNVEGRIVDSGPVSKTIPVNELNNGFFILHILMPENEVVVRKFMKLD